ncbi:MAG: hypothetical protein H6578_07800 [Chitinophagales bacterium]|nr:hypothetical protein [Chitinophagales bacterium]
MQINDNFSNLVFNGVRNKIKATINNINLVSKQQRLSMGKESNIFTYQEYEIGKKLLNVKKQNEKFVSSDPEDL